MPTSTGVEYHRPVEEWVNGLNKSLAVLVQTQPTAPFRLPIRSKVDDKVKATLKM
jgi:hypothetical protein